MIIGTAGHIDHGKTTLVQALTGVNTDRLPEEKKRGITIELGYASMPGPNDQAIAFVDVPGHERLVRTMVAGATGIDFGLLLVAADDGVMPQTLEHLTILSLLKVTQGAAVITKADRCDAIQVQQRVQQVRTLLDSHGLDQFTVWVVSAVTGEGVSELKTHLQQTCASLRPHTAPCEGFRMGLDRVFTLDGIGTVVAGSVTAGSVQVGETLCLSHNPRTVYRVRSVQRHNQAVDLASRGQRCSIGLVGLDRNHVERGMTLCHPSIASITQRLDVMLQVALSEERPLRSGTQVHLHLGTQDVMAHVAILGAASIAPGEQGLAQLVVPQAPLSAWWGDRLILRDASASRTVAGARVLDVAAPSRYRQTPQRLACLQGLTHTDPEQRLLAQLAHAPMGVQGQQWLTQNGFQSWPFDPASVQRLFYEPKQQWLILQEALQHTQLHVLNVFKAFHARLPDDLGPDASRARRLAAPRMPEALWNDLLSHLVRQAQLSQRSGFYHLPDHAEQLRSADQVVAQRALPMLLQGRFDPPWVRDIAGKSGIPENQVRSVLVRLSRTGEVYQIVKDLFYHPQVVRELAQLAREAHQKEGQVLAATFRDATGLGRKRAIQILEFFDRIGFLRRVGDAHFLRQGASVFDAVTPS